MEFYLSKQKFNELIELIQNHESLDDSQKIYYFAYLFLKAEVNELNYLQARDKIVQILNGFGINFEDKYFFSNGYMILKINNFEENINYSTLDTLIPERWNYWLNKWEIYNNELFYHNILSIFGEMINSISQFAFKTNRKLIDIDIKLLTVELKKIIGFKDLLKADKMEELKKAIKDFNSFRNDLKNNKENLQKLIFFLMKFFEKEFSLEKTIEILFKELEKKAGRGLKLLDLISDILYLMIKTRNPDISPSLIKNVSNKGIDMANGKKLKKIMREILMKMAKTDLEEYGVFFPIRNIQIISKIPSFPNIHFFHREIDESYKGQLGVKHPNIKHWVRVIVKAKGIKDAIFRSEKILKKYQNFGILKDLHFKLIRKNYFVIKNDKCIFNSHSIEELKFYTIKPLGKANGVELKEFIKTLETNLATEEFQRINILTELIIKIENTFDITNQLTFLWILLETLNESKLLREDFAIFLTIIDEIEIIQRFYILFYPVSQNNWDDFKNKHLSLTKLDNFPKDFTSKDFIDSLDILSDALHNNHIKQNMKEFSGSTSLSHSKRIKLKEELNLKLLLNIYKHRNEYFHSGFYDPIELGKVIPNLHKKIMIIVQSYISYLMVNKGKDFEDFKKKWIETYKFFIEQLNESKLYSESFNMLLELIEFK